MKSHNRQKQRLKFMLITFCDSKLSINSDRKTQAEWRRGTEL